MDNEILLSLSGISKSFLGVKALDEVSLEVNKGEIHAVIGENGAGKSTLMNIIFGSLRRDSGEIVFNGRPVNYKGPAEALDDGIAMIHQETRLVQQFTASENIYLGREDQFVSGGFMNNKARDIAAQELLKSLGLDISSTALVSSLPIAQVQLIEVARAIACEAKLIIMDEPTSSLSDKEIVHLFRIIKDLAAKGVSVIFISHKIKEIFDICDRVSVYRDGRYICTKYCSELTHDELIKYVVGRELTQLYPKAEAEIGDVVLEVKNLARYGVFQDINFKVRKGEILGFAGLAGAGRSEVAQAIFGIDKLDEGEIIFNGKPVKIHNPDAAVKLGMGMVTEDRLRRGIIAQMSVKDNMTLVKLKEFCSTFMNFISNKKEMAQYRESVSQMGVKVHSDKQRIDSLSGGNQQKAILGRWIMNNPTLMILDEPTRGIDVGSKSEIHRIIGEFVKQGMAIILISSEMPELLGMADRILVMREGRIVYETDREHATQETMGKYALG